MGLAKILIIDDTKSILDVLKDFFEFEDFEVYVETNGQKGIESALENLPHLILCDLMMPIKNGYEVYEELKANQITKDIPFLFLTADVNIQTKMNDLGDNSVDYILKPFNLSKVMETVKRNLAID
ncbi:Response regulator receiver domain-containing protein [Flavobacterium glycines]|uniref:Response regulator receiver domain-containing protein n=1 Tax=Flavobacterium glycines TaxID=551990 RepID=A0A1B9DRU4_9FLAO|nr:response regulator [Flavobacterium glycines]OCB72410.1 hypothetical protein FBGL_07110 [Flavobacterium glycines]GEL09890.1 hypothetical protein FGL01_06290 [Flavobacterium glycines]SDI89657.1 Response regulator receiver domain-containing protein [Flavobacterium glycines]